MDRSVHLVGVSSILLAPLVAQAHHNTFALYDRSTIVELEGEVTGVYWRNPHVYIELSTTGPDGAPLVRTLETGSPAALTRSGINADSIKVGDRVRAAGAPSRTTEEGIFVLNILVPSGEELLMVASARSRWADERRGDYSYAANTEGDSSRPDLGIFRVWTSGVSTEGLRRVDLTRLPLTEAARSAYERFDPVAGLPIDFCTPKGMPMIMNQPFPMEFVREGSDILLRTEEYDLVRRIHMNQDQAPRYTPFSSLGYSIGRMDGSDLVVTTTHLDWPYFDQLGVPQSSESVIVERFSPAENGSRLNYERTITDPVNFSEPLVQQAYWVYIPDEEIKPYACTSRD